MKSKIYILDETFDSMHMSVSMMLKQPVINRTQGERVQITLQSWKNLPTSTFKTHWTHSVKPFLTLIFTFIFNQSLWALQVLVEDFVTFSQVRFTLAACTEQWHQSSDRALKSTVNTKMWAFSYNFSVCVKAIHERKCDVQLQNICIYMCFGI